ncbi:MAG: TetR family transcriptional regulator [Actinophytocola sp.]|nr:TetR family transcriptional regulator [Actinophytocola sp.]
MTTAEDARGGKSRATTGRRRGRPGYDLDSLLQVAARLFYERGYDGTSMDDLARKLGITKSAIYHHVSGKEELLRLATGRALDGLFAVADETEQLDGRAIDKLEHLVRGSVLVLSERLLYVTLLLRVRGNTKVERAALAKRREFDRLVARLVAQAEAEGDIRPDVDPAITARLLFGMVNSLIEWYKPRNGANSATLADAVTKVAFDGIRQPRGGDPVP